MAPKSFALNEENVTFGHCRMLEQTIFKNTFFLFKNLLSLPFQSYPLQAYFKFCEDTLFHSAKRLVDCRMLVLVANDKYCK